MKKTSVVPIIYAVAAAVFYALSTPFSKRLLGHVGPTFMAALLYLGAGIGMGALYLALGRKSGGGRLTRADAPYAAGMILLDIAAPILLMLGLKTATSASAALLNNFEIAATSVIALFVFKEAVSPRLWLGIGLITVSSVLLSVEDGGSLGFSGGALLILLAAVCWGFENNCTRRISNKNTYEIVILKGIFSGLGSLVIAVFAGESAPGLKYALMALLLGFAAYGLSIFFYIRAQRDLGAAKTSAYYAVAPFVGALLSYLLIKEPLSRHYVPALLIMIAGSAAVVTDTLGVGPGRGIEEEEK